MLLLLLLLAVVVVWGLRLRRPPNPPKPGPATGTGPVPQEWVDRLMALEARERAVDETTWAREKLAERCGDVVDALWDALNASTNRWQTLQSFTFGELLSGPWKSSGEAADGIARAVISAGDPRSTLGFEQWRSMLREAAVNGWQLERVEFRHNAFSADPHGRPLSSVFSASAHVIRPRENRRSVLRGDLEVEWEPATDPESPPGIRRVIVRQGTELSRSGDLPFTRMLAEEVAPPDRSFFIDPLMVYDLDDDGVDEVILAAKNRVYRRQPDGRYEARPLCTEPPGLLFTAVLGDFDGDDRVDLLAARFEGMVLFRGSDGGQFAGPGEVVWTAQPRFKYGQVLTCGDIDLDGDLDVWLGQYKSPYDRGQMPTPYFDANDGNPSWLLVNDGHGRFQDRTAAAGLDRWRNRRTYSASFVDLDADGDLDLLVVSDFAGVELYLNDGHGRFESARSRFQDPEGFGMAHALADFNRDGATDVFVTGMHCPTALRLDSLSLVRPGFEASDAQRPRMTRGNRLFLQARGGWTPALLQTAVARSGLSWRCVAQDFNNDAPEVE